jgi:GPH family glycoside/pentoside/hexuronide:cation symporter
MQRQHWLGNKLAKLFPSGGLSKGRKALVAVSCGALSLTGTVVHSSYAMYYTDFLGMPAAMIGVVYLLFTIWNAINDPLFGFLIERRKYHEKRGKYTYLMRTTAPLIILSMIAMFFAQPDWSDWLVFAFLLVTLCAFDTAYTLFSVSYGSYSLCVAPTKEERVDLSLMKSYISMIPAFLGSMVPVVFLTQKDMPRATIILVYSGIALFGGLLFWVSTRSMKDSPDFYTAKLEDESFSRASRDIIFGILKSKPFLMYTLFCLLARGAFANYMVPYGYYMKWAIDTHGLDASLPDIMGGVVQALIYPVIAVLVRKIGVRDTMKWAMIPTILCYVGLFFAPSFWIAAVLYALLMIGFASTWGTGDVLMGAIVDEDERRTGLRKSSLYMGLSSLITIPFTAVHSLIYMSLLQAFGYVSGENVMVQTPQAIFGIRLATTLVPAFFILLGYIPLFLFPIGHKEEKELSEFSEGMRRKEQSSEIPASVTPPVA